MSKDKLISKFKVPKNLFKSSGYSFKVKQEESLFLKAAYKKLTG